MTGPLGQCLFDFVLGRGCCSDTGLFPSEIKAFCSVRCGPTMTGSFHMAFEGAESRAMFALHWARLAVVRLFECKVCQWGMDLCWAQGVCMCGEEGRWGERGGTWDPQRESPSLHLSPVFLLGKARPGRWESCVASRQGVDLCFLCVCVWGGGW